MGVDLLSEDADYRISTMGANHPATGIQPNSFFDGFFGAGVQGAVGGGAAVARTGVDAMEVAQAYAGVTAGGMSLSPFSMFTRAYGMATDTYEEVSGQKIRDQIQAVEKWSQIDPRTVGTGGQVLGSVTRGFTIFGLGTLAGGPFAGASLYGGAEGYQTFRDLRAEGVDAGTAATAGAVTGVTSGLGALLPASFGAKSLVGMMVSGAAINTGFGAAQRGSVGAVLDANGYGEMATRYRMLDGEALAADLILGAAFGGVARYTDGAQTLKPTKQEIMDALEIRRQAQNARGTFGLPINPEAAALDAQLSDRALAAVLSGRPLEIDGSEAQRIVDNTIPDPQTEALLIAYDKAMREELGDMVEMHDPANVIEEPVVAPADEFTGTITGVHGSEQPLDSIKPANEIDPESRYDGSGGVWGDGFYSADSGDYSWFRGSDLRMADYNAATAVESTFSRAAIFTPETTVALLKRLGVKGVDTPEQLAQILRDKGYDGAIVRQFAPTDIDALMLKLQAEGVTSDTFIDQGGESAFMNQIVHFAPDKGVRIVGEEATMGPLVRERRKLKEELNAKAEARGFDHANDAYGTIYDVEKYAERRTETEKQNYDYALKMAGDKYPRAKEFADETAAETARLKELDRKILGMAKPPKPKQASAPKPETPAPPPPEQAEALKEFDPVVTEQIEKLSQMADTNDTIEMPDGTVIPMSRLKEQIVENMAMAEKDVKLFDVAIACFLRSE